MTAKTLVILNPYAAGGTAGRVWQQIEPFLWERLGELVVAITQRPEEVAAHLDEAYAGGIRRVIAIGGDGTNHALINALANANEARTADPMIYGNLPIGTGRDWARGIGIPYQDARAAVEWIARAHPTPTDIGMINAAHGETRYFLNIASAGLGGAVVKFVNRARRRPWTFLQATVTALLREPPPALTIRLDGQEWYTGKTYLVAVANGTTFGHGMRIAPHAQQSDGVFDVVLVEDAPRTTILAALGRVYAGTHLTHPAVRTARASMVEIASAGSGVELECDGEYAAYDAVTLRVRPGLLSLLR